MLRHEFASTDSTMNPAQLRYCKLNYIVALEASRPNRDVVMAGVNAGPCYRTVILDTVESRFKSLMRTGRSFVNCLAMSGLIVVLE